MNKVYIFSVFTIVLCQCTSTDYRDQSEAVKAPNTETVEEPQIDLFTLQNELGMVRDNEDLGFAEKTFNDKKFSLLYFRILCRDSNGTVQNKIYADELTPLVTNQLQWSIAQQSGIVASDVNGFAQIRVLTTKSISKKRLSLKHGNWSMQVRAEEITRLVMPSDWCMNK